MGGDEPYQRGENIAEEFFKQGDRERALGMRVLDFCDRTKKASRGRGASVQHIRHTYLAGLFIRLVHLALFGLH